MKRLAGCAFVAVCAAMLTLHVTQGLAPATVVPVSVNGGPAACRALDAAGNIGPVQAFRVTVQKR